MAVYIHTESYRKVSEPYYIQEESSYFLIGSLDFTRWLYHPVTVPSYQCTLLSLYHPITVPSYHCTILSLYHPINVPSYHCTILVEYHHFTITLYLFTILSLYHHSIHLEPWSKVSLYCMNNCTIYIESLKLFWTACPSFRVFVGTVPNMMVLLSTMNPSLYHQNDRECVKSKRNMIYPNAKIYLTAKLWVTPLGEQ
jgi:hypothetical protein